MTPERWQQIKELLQTALELGPDERAAFLDRACAGDPSLRAEVEAFVAFQKQAENFLVAPISEVAAHLLTDDQTDGFENRSSSLGDGMSQEAPLMGREENVNFASDPLIGRTLGEFTIREKLGEGGFGVVYRAEQLTLARGAVVKVMHARHRGTRQMVERFMREARLASRLEHPYIAHVYAFGAEQDGLLWIAMELVHGTTLNEILQTQGPLSLERFVPLLDKICEVVQTAHEYGIIHRDIKPANVMVLSRAGRLLPKLLDFGIAKLVDRESTLSTDDKDAAILLVTQQNRVPDTDPSPVYKTDGQIDAVEDLPAASEARTLVMGSRPISQAWTIGAIGSPYYMAPEQWQKAAMADARTDIYALGVLAYESITGHPPFQGSSHSALAEAHTSKPIPQLSSLFPAALNAVMAKAMAKRPEERYSTATEFAAAFREAAGLAEQQTSLPQLNELLEESLLSSAPQPLAEAVANFKSARNAHQARDRMVEIFRVAVRYVGLLAIACCAQVGSKNNTAAALIALRNLCRHRLSEEEWIELARELCKPFTRRRNAFPIPELVSLFFEQDGDRSSQQMKVFESLLKIEETAASSIGGAEEQVHELLTEYLPEVTTLLQALSFLWDYRLVVPRSDYAECWMGLNRMRIVDCGLRINKPTQTDFQSVIHNPQSAILIDADGQVILSLWPLMQVAEPAPGAREELFFFEGKGRHGAKLVAMPSRFERQDESVWDWFSKYFFEAEEYSGAGVSKGQARYPGLSSFTASDAEFFFGREKETELFLNRMRMQPLLAVVGPSGVGKSSFVQAGVIPGLPVGWQAITLRPGPAPLAALTARLAKEGIEVGDLREALEGDLDALGKSLRAAAERSGCSIVLVIDQFEEIFTLCLDREEQNLFSEGIGRAARSAEEPVRVILTLRDDFLIRAEQMRGLRNRISQELQLLTTPAPDDLLRILTEPARRSGYEFDDKELPREIVRAIADQTGTLPLLAFTAAKLWELRDRQFKQLRRKTYEAMGGVGGALAQHAEALMAQLTKDEQRLLREAFRHLVTSEGTRAVLTRPDLIKVLGGGNHAETVLERLIAARLLMASEAEGGVERIEVVHEALLSAWPRLVKWRQENAEGARLRDQLRAAARQWEERGRTKDLLWRGEALREYQLWHSRYPGRLTESEEEFGTASLAEVRRGRRAKRLLLSMVIISLVIGASVLFWQRQQAKYQLLEAYEEQGRQDLLKGDALKASVYLSEVYQKGKDSPSLRFLLAQAMKPVDAKVISIEGHKEGVNCAMFSPDGKRIVTGSDDRTAKIWDAFSGKLLTSLEGHTDEVISVAFSPDGTRIITASRDKTAKVWDALSGKMLASLEGHKDILRSAAFSPDGKRIVTASFDQTAKVWDAADYELLITLKGHKDALSSAAFSPDGKQIVTGSGDRTAKVWDAFSGKMLISLEGHTATVSSAAFSTDGKRIVTASWDQTAKVWDASSGRLLISLEGHTARVYSALFNPDGKRIVTASWDKTAKIWDAETGKQLDSLEGHTSYLYSAAFSPDGTRIVTTSFDKTVRIWDATINNMIASLEGHTDWLDCAKFSPDGTRIATASRDRTAKIWDAATGKMLFSLEGNISDVVAFTEENFSGIINSAAFSPDGTRIVTAGGDKGARLWDAASGKLLTAIAEHSSPVCSAEFSPDGKRVVTSSFDKTAKVWDASSGRLLISLEGHTARVSSALFSPDGKRIVTSSWDKSARIWDAETGKFLISLEGHMANLNSAAFSSDGKYIVTASQDSTAKVWDAASGKLLISIEGHTGPLASATFSPDGKLVVTSSADTTAKVWDSESGKLLTSLEGHTGDVFFAAFSPDGERIVTASMDKTAKVWDVHLETRSPSEIAEIVKQRVPFHLDQGRLIPNR